jgi:hypothetical protein
MLADILHPIAAQFQQEEHDYFPRPSLAGPERCIRSLVYWGMGIERDPLPGRSLHTFNDGKWHEESSNDWIRQSPFELHSEQMHVDIWANLPFLPERICKVKIGEKECGKKILAGYIAGHIDGIIMDILRIDRHYEHKGINHFSFQRYWEKEELPLDYITQCALYLRGLNAINPELKEAILLIKNKNTSAYLEFLFEYDYQSDAVFVINKVNSLGEKIDIKESIEHVTQDAFEKFAKVQEYIEKKTLPKRQYEKNHWRCEYCGWGNICWAGWEKEFDELKTDLIIPDEYADTVRYYQELGAQASEANAERKVVKERLITLMDEAGAKEGRCGEYIVQRLLRHRKEYTVPASSHEELQVTKVKGGNL